MNSIGEVTQRDKLQFPIQENIRYQCMKGGRYSAVGTGRTTQISSREVSFTTPQPLRQGEKVRLALDWPALLDNTCLMKLEICGSVVQIEPGSAAVRIVRYEFRTRGHNLHLMQ